MLERENHRPQSGFCLLEQHFSVCVGAFLGLSVVVKGPFFSLVTDINYCTLSLSCSEVGLRERVVVNCVVRVSHSFMFAV